MRRRGRPAGGLLGGGLVLSLTLLGCDTQSPPPPLPSRDGGPTAPISEPLVRPDLGHRCGNDVCDEPDENFFSCPTDCRPKPAGRPSFKPDPGYIDPPAAPPLDPARSPPSAGGCAGPCGK